MTSSAFEEVAIEVLVGSAAVIPEEACRRLEAEMSGRRFLLRAVDDRGRGVMLSDVQVVGSACSSRAGVVDRGSDYGIKVTVANERVVIRDDGAAGWRVVLVSGVVFASYGRGDADSQRHVYVRLGPSGLATQAEVANAFGHVCATQCRWERSYRDEGMRGLFTEPPRGRRSTMSTTIEDAVVKLHSQGLGMRPISARLGLTLHQVSGGYRRRSLAPHLAPKQEELYAVSESEIDSEATDHGEIANDPPDGDAVRVAAEAWDGLLVPQYVSSTAVAWAGVLLALPVLEIFSKAWNSLGLLTFDGLQTMVTVMVCLALWRVKRPEHLTGLAPWELGRTLELPRVPRVETGRRKSQVTRLTADTGQQTKVLTTRADIEPEEVMWRMFASWRQESFSKYMLDELAIDRLVEHGTLLVDPKHERQNPARRALSNEKGLKAHILGLEGKRCQLIGRPETRHGAPPGYERSIPGQEEANKPCGEIEEARQLPAVLEAKRAEVPERISAGDLKRLRTERQQLATILKNVGYRIETELVHGVADHFARTEDERRKLIAAALRSSADMVVTDHELRATIAPPVVAPPQPSDRRSLRKSQQARHHRPRRTTPPRARLRHRATPDCLMTSLDMPGALASPSWSASNCRQVTETPDRVRIPAHLGCTFNLLETGSSPKQGGDYGAAETRPRMDRAGGALGCSRGSSRGAGSTHGRGDHWHSQSVQGGGL